MTVATAVNPFSFADQYEEQGVVLAGTRGLRDSDAQTPVMSRFIDRFQLVMMPFAAAAALTFSASTTQPRIFVSSVASSRTRRLDRRWWFDDWNYTTEAASLAEVQALNRLLALPAAEGLVLEYPDE